MRGVLYVTDDLEAYLAKNPRQELKTTEWKPDDFTADDLKRVAHHRDFTEAKLLFTTLGCAQCHRMSKDAKPASLPTVPGGPSRAVGPDIDETVKKYKHDPKAVLLEMLQPSRNIDTKYRQIILALDDGSSLTGVVVEENDAEMTILSGTPSKEQKIVKKGIDAQRVSPVSIMPAGVLNTLDKEQILDLLAYVLAVGNPDDPSFKHGH